METTHLITDRDVTVPNMIDTAPTNVYFHIHWLSITLVPNITLPNSNYEWLASEIQRRVNAACQKLYVWHIRRRSWQGYQRVDFGPFGARLGIYPFQATKTGLSHMHLVLPGGWLESVPFTATRLLLQNLRELVVLHPSRIDLAFDYAPFTVREAWNAIEQGQIRIHCRRPNPDSDKRNDSFRFITAGTGQKGNTVYAGSKTSNRQLVIYDRRGFTRVELRLKTRRANLAFDKLIMSNVPENNLPVEAMGIMRSYVDFIDRIQCSNVSRAPLLPWWERFVGNAIPMRDVIHRHTCTEERSEQWLRQRIAASLAKVAATKSDPIAFYKELYAIGLAKLQDRYNKAMAQLSSDDIDDGNYDR